jgi:hypothetical protein
MQQNPPSNESGPQNDRPSIQPPTSTQLAQDVNRQKRTLIIHAGLAAVLFAGTFILLSTGLKYVSLITVIIAAYFMLQLMGDLRRLGQARYNYAMQLQQERMPKPSPQASKPIEPSKPVHSKSPKASLFD